MPIVINDNISAGVLFVCSLAVQYSYVPKRSKIQIKPPTKKDPVRSKVTESDDIALMPSFKDATLEVVTLLAAEREDLASENMLCYLFQSTKGEKVVLMVGFVRLAACSSFVPFAS